MRMRLAACKESVKSAPESGAQATSLTVERSPAAPSRRGGRAVSAQPARSASSSQRPQTGRSRFESSPGSQCR